MPRPRTYAAGALALLLCAAPFVPRGGGDEDGAITPSGQQEYAARPAATAGLGKLTPQARAEIDRVVAEGQGLRLPAGRVSGRVAARDVQALAGALARCAEFEGQRYCLGTGWTTSEPAEVQARVAATAAPVAARGAASRGTEETGDLDTLDLLRRTAALPAAKRAALERAELEQAARSVAKVWLLRHEIDGTPLPEGFLERHPEARAETAATPSGAAARSGGGTDATETAGESAGRTKTRADYPGRSVVLNPKRVAEQTRSYWCGPATMQMIAWGWSGESRSQDVWARRLRTTTDGSSIHDMVRVVNNQTGFDRESYAGPYIVLDISDYSYNKWLKLLMRHVADYRAPVVLHPLLHKRFFPYLDDDASGHFQVGRGYDQRGDKPVKLGYFEPWNQQRFDPSEPYISRVQWRQAYRSYRANQAHPHRNIGV